MSARAAWRLETLGFNRVYRYTAGKSDWSGSGLPMEGKAEGQPTAGSIIRRGVPTCRLDERFGEVRARVRAAGWDSCVVVGSEGVVLGRLRNEVLEGSSEVAVDSVMESGPTTIRPDVSLQSIVARLRRKNVEQVLVTTPDGELLGVLFREDAERQVTSADAAPHDDEDACECGV